MLLRATKEVETNKQVMVFYLVHIKKVLPNRVFLEFINKLVLFVTISPNPHYNNYPKHVEPTNSGVKQII